MNWLDRIVPLPQEIEITGNVRIKAGEISLYICGGRNIAQTGPVHTAARLLHRFAPGTLGNSFSIKIALTENCQCTWVPAKVLYKLSKVPNPDQAYAITSSSDGDGLNLIATTPTGLLYAARTLYQLINPTWDVKPEDELIIPMVNILDWPDIAQRGQWGGNAASDLEWTSQWKLNHLEACVQIKSDITGKTSAHIDSELISKGSSLGVKVVPYILHLEQVAAEMDGIDRECESVPNPNEPLPSDYQPGICCSKSASVNMIAEWLRSVYAVEGVSDVCIWLSEQSSPCYCPDCSGKEQFVLETECICKAFEIILKEHSGESKPRLRLLLTQGSYPVNDKIIQVKHPDVGITYYDGGRTYDSSHSEMIYPLLEDYSRSGGWLGCYPQVTHCWRTIFPWTAPQFIKFRAQEFVSKKLDSITGYAVSSNRQHEFNIMAMAEWLWNADGRNPEEFARAFATVAGYEHPDAFASWAMLAGEAGWHLAESRLLLSLIFDPTLGLAGQVEPDHRFEKAGILKIDDLGRVMQIAQQALDAALNSGRTTAILESECCLAGLKAYELLDQILPLIVKSALSGSEIDELSNALNQLDQQAAVLADNLLKWAKSLPDTPSSRIYDTAFALLRTCDCLRAKGIMLGIPDPEPALRLKSLGEWNESTFGDSNQAYIEYEIGNIVDKEGGWYNIGAEFIDSACHTDILSIEAFDDSQTSFAKAENIPGNVSIWERWKEFPILLPKRETERMLIRVSISRSDNNRLERRTCSGRISIRKGVQ